MLTMQQEVIINEANLVNGQYYMIINLATKTALSIPPTSDPKKQSLVLETPDQNNIRQVWMIQQVKPNYWQIVHAISALVLQNMRNQVKLQFGNWKKDQLFYVKRSKVHQGQIWIKQSEFSIKMVHFAGKLKCSEADLSNESAIWKIVKVRNNLIINRSCILQLAYSGQVIDIPRASDKTGTVAVQYPLNNRLNQRFNIVRFNKHYMIQNLKSRLFLQLKSSNPKQGTQIVQSKQSQNQSQLWHICYIGNNLYQIQPQLDRSLYLGITDKNIFRECAEITLSKDRDKCFWRIIGYIQTQ